MDGNKMTTCKACGENIAKGVKKCVHCGKDQRSFFMRHKILSGILVLILLVAIGGAMGGGDGPNLTEPAEVAEAEPSTSGVEVAQSTEPDVPREYKSALSKAKSYSDTMNMSKLGIYNQLISEYGENFPEDAAQYAIDNVQADWKENALAKAKTYADTMNMSNAAVYEQLVSPYGEQFTAEEAQYAIDNLE